MTRLTLTQAIVPALWVGMLAGCDLSASVSGQNDGDMGANGNADGPTSYTGPDMAINPKALFVANVQPLLLADCGTCHGQAGGSYPGFLVAAPDVFTTFLAYPGLVGPTPETSRILLKDVHVGPSYHTSNGYTPTAKLQADAKIIADWITTYNAAGGATAGEMLDMTAKATIPPFVPVMGSVKSIDLGELNPALTGTTLSFTPTAVGTTSIQLTNITITATASVGVKAVTPLFSTYDAAAPTVPVLVNYDYVGKEIDAFPGSTAQFSPSVVIFAYTAGQLLDVSFDMLDPATGSAPDMGHVGACKNVPGFTTFKPQLTGTAGINCNSCHTAGSGGFNTNGITVNANDTATCAEVLLNTTPATPNMSAIYLTVTGNGAHTGGKLSTANAATFLTALTTWLNTEK